MSFFDDNFDRLQGTEWWDESAASNARFMKQRIRTEERVKELYTPIEFPLVQTADNIEPEHFL